VKKLLILLSFVLCSTAVSKVLVDDDEKPPTSSFHSESGSELRRIRRVGIGLSAAGPLGAGGINMELNFSHDAGIMLGFGGAAPGIQTFEVKYKSILAGEWMLPYFTVGYAHWGNYGTNGPITETYPSYLGDKLLTASQKASGQVQENLVYPGFGLQFFQLSGPLAGHSLYIEGNLLLDIGQFVAVPTASIGYLYYF
jgi:hypothetical protein